jgi:D-citramalate synthase
MGGSVSRRGTHGHARAEVRSGQQVIEIVRLALPFAPGLTRRRPNVSLGAHEPGSADWNHHLHPLAAAWVVRTLILALEQTQKAAATRPFALWAAWARANHGAPMRASNTPPLPRSAPAASVTLMDTTLRDGEQTPQTSFGAQAKLEIARALLGAGVDRIEVCSARVSPGERAAAQGIAAWARAAGLLSRIEALGYVDGARSVDWIRDTGIQRMNLLLKGSERHCELQLGLTRAQHLAQAAATLRAAGRAELEVSGVYLEDWSRGVAESPSYVSALVEGLAALGVRRFYLCDTLGVLTPERVTGGVQLMRQQFPALRFEFHGHDDYGLATANCLAAALAGIDGLHTTVNGLGERAGNACLAQVAVVVRDHAQRSISVDENQLVALSQLVTRLSAWGVSHNEPIVGEHVFTQTAGIHADGDAKASLYCSSLAPERFARRREYALGKLSGQASLLHHLRALGLELSASEQARLLERVVALGDEQRTVRRSDLPALVAALASSTIAS